MIGGFLKGLVGPVRILYVEDDVWMAKTVELMLQKAGYEFDTADCGARAIELATGAGSVWTNKYDLILLDIMLPDVDGYEVIEQIRDAHVKTPFLIQTGLLDRSQIESNGVSLGVTEYIIKPFNNAELIEKIERVVANPKLDDPSESPAQPTTRPHGKFKTTERRHRRFPTLKSAKISGDPDVDCVVLNMSHGGAAIRLPSEDIELPATFALALKSAAKRQCQLCWQLGNKAGVKFI